VNDDLRAELRFLVSQVRGEVERERRLGHDHLMKDPEFARMLEAGAVPVAPGDGMAAATEPTAAPTSAPSEAAPAKAAAPPRTAAARGKQMPAPAVKLPEPADAAEVTPHGKVAPSSRALPAVGMPRHDRRDLKKLAEELALFSAEAAACMKCGLCQTRTKVVYGSGTARQPLLFVGEAPGFNEDQQGLPFVGQAGKLLTDIIAATGFERSEVYIANLLKCRPPENRDPQPHEIESCLPWLERQIAIIQPRVICTLGKYSAQILTGKPKATIGALRGKVFHYNGIPVVPTYHPAFLLRSPSFKRATWEDVQLVRDLYLAAEAGSEGAGSSTE
jgi:uracil-DNA glycosylase family 4